MVKVRTIISRSPAQTQKIARELSRKILHLKNRKRARLDLRESRRALIIALKGELGSGKTTFVQGLARGLGVAQNIKSSTFIIMRNYFLLRKNIPYKKLIHIDAYRIKKPQEILKLEWRNMLESPENIIVTEWPEYLGRFISRADIIVRFEHVDTTTRKITL